MSRSKNKEVVSPKKIESNRRNALRSTGPKSPEGKKMSRWNALRHGLLAREIVIPNGPGMENEEEFRELLSGLMEDLQPEGSMEEILVEEIAVSYWRLRRVIRSENGRIRQEFEHDGRMGPLVGREPGSEAEKAQHARLALPRGSDAEQIFRYGTAIERTLFRALQHLERLQRRRVASGEQQNGRSDEESEKLVTFHPSAPGSGEAQRQPVLRKAPGGADEAAKAESGSDQGVAFPTRPSDSDPAAPHPDPGSEKTLSEGAGEQPRATKVYVGVIAFLPNEPRRSFRINGGLRLRRRARVLQRSIAALPCGHARRIGGERFLISRASTREEIILEPIPSGAGPDDLPGALPPTPEVTSQKYWESPSNGV